MGGVTATGPVVGFDLDMTLVDSSAGIVATLRAALADVLGVPPEIGDDDIRPWIGMPLEDTVAALVPAADPVAVADRYRETYAVTGVPLTHLLPGVHEAFRAIREAGGRVLVISAKSPAGVEEVLTHVGLATGEAAPDLAVGGLFAADKGHRLRAEGADVYVGDHTADMEAARVAGATSVGVATGTSSPADLVAAGAEVVLDDLTAFPGWLRSHPGANAGAPHTRGRIA
jgi:phosphoglycolate phosphatase-like HAD superfamily hydrolase